MTDEARLQEIRERADFASGLKGDGNAAAYAEDVPWLLSLVEQLQRERDEALEAETRLVRLYGDRAEAAEAALAEARATARDSLDSEEMPDAGAARIASASVGWTPTISSAPDCVCGHRHAAHDEDGCSWRFCACPAYVGIPAAGDKQ